MLRQQEAEDESVRLTEEEAEELRQDTLRMLGDGTLFLADPDGGATTSLLVSTANDVALIMFGAMESARSQCRLRVWGLVDSRFPPVICALAVPCARRSFGDPM
jgi:hypothetical protein